MTTLLIDSDFYCYKAATASETELEFDADTTFIVGDTKTARKIFHKCIDQFRTKFATYDVVLAWSDLENFRKDVDPNYKSNRSRRKPAGYKKLKEWAKTEYPSVQFPKLEADDVLGILATNNEYDKPLIVSPDKDLLQIPCRVWNGKRNHYLSEDDCLRKVFEQALTGDPTDGYKGCIGVGLKSARQLLRGCETATDYWDAVRTAYSDHGQTEEDAVRNLRVARILRSDDWNPETMEPILYSPWN